MRAGEFPDGAYVLRAKIDMASPNLNMRDPVLYRIRRESHHRTGDRWCIYPMYDYTHPISDAMEGITHSICTLEFEDHRPFYDWVLDNLPVPCHPQQIEFARLNLNYTVMSKRKLLELVDKAYVRGWDDPRLPTIAGLRRRGYTPEAIRDFAELVGVAKRESMVDMALLEHCLREDLNKQARRVMAVLQPLKVVITNYPEGKVEEVDAENNPEDPARRHAQAPLRARDLHRAGRLPRGPAQEVLPPLAGPRDPPQARLLHPLRRGGQGRAGATSPSCAAPTTPSRAAARPRTAARCWAPPTGCRPPTPSTPRCGSTTSCSPSPTPRPRRRRRTSRNT